MSRFYRLYWRQNLNTTSFSRKLFEIELYFYEFLYLIPNFDLEAASFLPDPQTLFEENRVYGSSFAKGDFTSFDDY